MNDGRIRAALFNLIGLIFSVVPVSICVLLYFPLWRGEGAGALISGASLLLLLLCSVPLMRFFKRAFSSLSAHTMWFLIFLFFFAVSKIADQMCVIAFVGFTGNLAGGAFFRLARRSGRGGINEA